MNAVKFRIENYKSIVDSGWCQLASDITILAGKNESGKTAVLEALRDFGRDVETIPDQALPINPTEDSEPKITVCFKIEAEELQQLLDQRDIELDGEVYMYMKQKYAIQNGSAWSIPMHKSSDGYWLDYDFMEILDTPKRQKFQQIKNLCTDLAESFNLQCPDIDAVSDSTEILQATVQQFMQEVHLSDSEYDLTDLQTITEEFATANYSHRVLDALVGNIQPFIFFNDFSNILDFEISADSARENEAFLDFAQVAGLNLDEFLGTTDRQRRRNILSQCSANISGDFHEYWQQDNLNLKVEADRDSFCLGVEKEGGTILFSLEQRSKGFQWFVSFYLRLKAKGGKPSIILIDEPGMYLHAQAQHDVLKTLEKLSEVSTIVFSTHSPYLIDHHRLDRVRLIQKNSGGTVIENKIHKNANTDTLTPIMTAIGLDLSSNSLSIVGQKNVLLEGISDYYYLQALRSNMLDEEIKFIPCVGATKIPQLVSLMIGWGLAYHVLLDNDTEGRRVRDGLEKTVPGQHSVSFVSSESETAIEDLFANEDFNKFIIGDSDTKCAQDMPNTKYLKKARMDKVLLAKNFFEESEQNPSIIEQLNPDTTDKFRELFRVISESLQE